MAQDTESMQSTVEAIVVRDGTASFTERHGVAPRGAGEIAIDVLQAGVCETDLQIVAGYMDFEGVLGHEFVGIAGSGRFAGQRVVGEINVSCRKCATCNERFTLTSRPDNHCPHRTVMGIVNRDGAFARQTYLPQENLHLVPDSVTDDQATLVEPLAAAFRIQSQLDLGQYGECVVIGDGRLGYLCAQVLGQAGCRVSVVGKHTNKLGKFESLGFKTYLADELPSRRFCDMAVDCCGSESGIETALRWLRPEGMLVLKTTVTKQHQIWLAPLVIDEIKIVGSRCGPFDIALQALVDQRVEVDSLITARRPLHQGIEALELAASGEHMKVILDIKQN